MSSTQQSIITKVGSNVLQDAGTSMPLRDRVKLMGPPSSEEYLAVPYYLGSFDSTDIGAEINKKILFETILPKYPPTVFFTTWAEIAMRCGAYARRNHSIFTYPVKNAPAVMFKSHTLPEGFPDQPITTDTNAFDFDYNHAVEHFVEGTGSEGSFEIPTTLWTQQPMKDNCISQTAAERDGKSVLPIMDCRVKLVQTSLYQAGVVYPRTFKTFVFNCLEGTALVSLVDPTYTEYTHRVGVGDGVIPNWLVGSPKGIPVTRPR